MSKLSTRSRIVVGVDGSPGSKAAVQWAAHDAELRDVPLTLVHVLPVAADSWLPSALLPTWTRSEQARGQKLLDEARWLACDKCQRDPAQIYCEMPSALTVPALVEMSKDADLVVVGCLGTGTLRGR